MQRQDLHHSSMTEMPIVGRNVNEKNEQTILNTIYLTKRWFFLRNFADLKVGFFHPNIGKKKRFDIRNITVKRPKISPANMVEQKTGKKSLI